MLRYGVVERQALLGRLERERFDVVVVGGGITGAGIVRDAAARGLKAALLEKDDFAQGTSSRSSKLVHGGLRYLEQYDFGLVFESTQERARLTRLARHAVRPLPFVLPVFAGSRHPLWFLDLGLWLYDALGTFHGYRLHRRLAAAEAARLEPALRSRDLTGALLYYDAATDDARLTLENVLAAHRQGAVPASRMEVRGLSFDGGRVRAVEAVDRLSGRTLEVRTRCVVCAAGPWTGQAAERLDAARTGPRLRPTRGSHLVVPRERLPVSHAVVMAGPRDRRVMFAIPWQGATVLGTTDTDYAGSPDAVFADRADVDYLLETANAHFPAAGLSPADVIGTWSGLRPLLSAEGVAESQVSREHAVTVDPRGVVIIAGGKLTTYRLMAAEVVEAALPFVGRAVPASPTGRMLLPYAEDVPSEDAEAAAVARLASARRLPPGTALRLLLAYGGRAGDVLDLAAGDASLLEPIHPALPWLRVEAIHAARHEAALSLEDFLCRRTPLFFLDRGQCLAQAADVARLMARETGWDAAEQAAQVAAVGRLADAHMACVR